MLLLQTWLHCTPVETPTAMSVAAQIPEVNPHSVGVGQEDRRLEVGRRGRRVCGVATALVHQERAVPVGDCDVVACAVFNTSCDVDLEVGELQSQDLSALNFYGLGFLRVPSVVAIRVVW